MGRARMMRFAMGIALCGILSASLAADGDGFKRERTKDGELKDALEGKAPPPLKVTDWQNTDGKPVDLAKLRGKVVLLDFWGTWCPPCRKSISALAG